MAEKTMREIDTEAPVVWPAWCYSGKKIKIILKIDHTLDNSIFLLKMRTTDVSFYRK